MSKLKVLVLTGPTAVGKSRVAIDLAGKINAEIISADSMQIYFGMDIGTAKPSAQELRKVGHHLIDVLEPGTDYSVAEYQEKARQAIHDISQKDKLPLLVGGSGLYIRAAIDKLEFPRGTLSSPARKRWEAELKNVGPEALHKRLQELDAEAAKNIHPHNARRVIRALEVIESTGCLFSQFQKEWSKWESVYDAEIVALSLPRDRLYAKIDARVGEMIKAGLIDETKKLVDQGYGEAITSKQALGYRQIIDYLQDQASLEECIESIKRNTRHFAKRQITWFRKDPRIRWINVADKSRADVVNEIICYLQTKKYIS